MGAFDRLEEIITPREKFKEFHGLIYSYRTHDELTSITKSPPLASTLPSTELMAEVCFLLIFSLIPARELTDHLHRNTVALIHFVIPSLACHSSSTPFTGALYRHTAIPPHRHAPNTDDTKSSLKGAHNAANMANPLDHYATLEVSRTASVGDIKKAHHHLALLHHPDKNRGSESMGKAFMKGALDTNKRTIYDATFKRRAYQLLKEKRTKEEESVQKRRQWWDWVDAQEKFISTAKEEVEALQKDLDMMDKQDEEAQSVFTPWTWGVPVVDEEERHRFESDRLQRNVVRTVKQEKFKEVMRRGAAEAAEAADSTETARIHGKAEMAAREARQQVRERVKAETERRNNQKRKLLRRQDESNRNVWRIK
ncbi:uncharacterized protein BDR25DRAFT_361045 [Lindgomyces ingoldianus]|uniref:Uncharacterized protein n=1 Tax=Lindgomyces ingoldianus TaxID=673940 RepID=A0ACB6QE87_9PLEO|nr:uncharacterized protein BDR25DRAFT_361045 [Lindgomyces ingoldianus]KAF2464815.1 hypothetical protein BDR25DRAFT_361045 [Lindgomyces ingoldianus]